MLTNVCKLCGNVHTDHYYICSNCLWQVYQENFADSRSCSECKHFETDIWLPNVGLCAKSVGTGYCIPNAVDNTFFCKYFERT